VTAADMIEHGAGEPVAAGSAAEVEQLAHRESCRVGSRTS
jgi:hypothetical protein